MRLPFCEGDSSRVPASPSSPSPPLMETWAVTLSDRNTSLPCRFDVCWAYEQRLRTDQCLLKGLMGSDSYASSSPPFGFCFCFWVFFSQERTIWFWFWQTSETTASWEHEKCFQTLFKSYLRWNAAANCSWIEPAAWVTESWLHVAFRSNLFAAFKLRVETMSGSSITVKSDCWISKTNAFQRHTLSDDNELCLRAEQCVFILGRGWKIGRPLSPLEKYSISKHGYHPTQLSYVIHQRSTLILLMSTKYVLFGDLILSTTRSKPFLLARFLFLAFIDQPESCFFCLAMFSQLFDLFQS